MIITLELNDKEISFLNKMVSDMASYEKVTNLEEAVRECIGRTMFEEAEHGS